MKNIQVVLILMNNFQLIKSFAEIMLQKIWKLKKKFQLFIM